MKETSFGQSPVYNKYLIKQAASHHNGRLTAAKHIGLSQYIMYIYLDG